MKITGTTDEGIPFDDDGPIEHIVTWGDGTSEPCRIVSVEHYEIQLFSDDGAGIFGHIPGHRVTQAVRSFAPTE